MSRPNQRWHSLARNVYQEFRECALADGHDEAKLRQLAEILFLSPMRWEDEPVWRIGVEILSHNKEGNSHRSERLSRFLNRILESRIDGKIDLLWEITAEKLAAGHVEDALNGIEAVIGIKPYNESSILVGYAGLLSAVLWKQEDQGSNQYGTGGHCANALQYLREAIKMNEDAQLFKDVLKQLLSATASGIDNLTITSGIQRMESSMYESSNAQMPQQSANFNIKRITELVKADPYTPVSHIRSAIGAFVKTKSALNRGADHRFHLEPILEVLIFRAEYDIESKDDADWLWTTLNETLNCAIKGGVQLGNWKAMSEWWPQLHLDPRKHPSKVNRELYIKKATACALLGPTQVPEIARMIGEAVGVLTDTEREYFNRFVE